jgi:hypothetical protein
MGDNSWCYLYGTTQGTYAAAQTACQGSGGSLVVYSGKTEQLLVEQYFSGKTGGGLLARPPRGAFYSLCPSYARARLAAG